MKKYRLNIDGKEVQGIPGQTILEVARENDIYIPTLCYDERTEIYGSCGLCVCEVEGYPELCKACATEIEPNMIIKTRTDRVIESRKTNLELLVSDHVGDCRPPCVTACPAETDCQGYVGLLANGEYEKALEVVKDRIPLPASLGRVCPHPCETACRRALVDEPVSIQWLKRFLADTDLAKDEDRFIPAIGEDTGKSVAVIGAGPMGLSAAYFLRQKGHHVTVFESMPKGGGMLRYGIPEYRLPKDVIDDEIRTIEQMGVTFRYNIKVGVDIPFKTVRADYDAVLMGIGAWKSTGVGCPGEDSDGVIGGIDFLRKVVRNEPVSLGKRVAIVGGGNTAMDACRTAIRLGAEKVYNIYRRTKAEMPADLVEIEEAEEEGVIFKNLTNPKEIIPGDDGRVSKVELQIMELGEPDASGRRRPVPVEGKTEVIDVDTMILAIGQAVDASMFGSELERTRKGAIKYNTKTFRTSIPGVFAGGDCGNDKISIAVEAIADARKASEMIDAYLNGVDEEYRDDFVVTRVKDELPFEAFENRERMCRPEMDQLSPEERRDNFIEVIPKGYTEEDAVLEASRCLECGCQTYYNCKLIALANEYQVEPQRFEGEKNIVKTEDNHPFISIDPNKCILCGLCVRACDEVMGVGALGFVNMGFETVVRPNMEKPLLKSGCISCGQCVSVCPTGAIREKQPLYKEVPVETKVTETTCSFCSLGCSLKIESCGGMLMRANPIRDGYVNKGLICGKGKWGFDCNMIDGKIEKPLMRDSRNREFRIAEYNEAFKKIVKRVESVAFKYGGEAVGVSISDRYTNEEAYAIKKMAKSFGAKIFCFNNRENGLEKVFRGVDASPNTIDEMLSTDVILMIGYNIEDNPIVHIKAKQAAENGAKIVLINPKEYKQDRFDFAYKVIYTENDMSFLNGVAKSLLDMGLTSDAMDFDKFKESLRHVEASEEQSEIAHLYRNAPKAMIVYAQNFASVSAATMIGNIALLTGHIGNPRDGILQLKPKNNSQGLLDMGIYKGAEEMEGVKALLVFGEDPGAEAVEGLEFLMVSDILPTETLMKADVVIPGTGFISANGTYTNTERRLMPVKASINENVEYSNWQIAEEIASLHEAKFGWIDEEDIQKEMMDTEYLYKYASIGEIQDGILDPQYASFVPAVEDKFVEPKKSTDKFMNVMNERIPTPCSMTE